MRDRPLTRKEAAQYLRNQYGVRISYRYLCKLASVGGGPIYSKSGDSVTYEVADLDAWHQSRTVRSVSNTSEYPQRQNLKDSKLIGIGGRP